MGQDFLDRLAALFTGGGDTQPQPQQAPPPGLLMPQYDGTARLANALNSGARTRSVAGLLGGWFDPMAQYQLQQAAQQAETGRLNLAPFEQMQQQQQMPPAGAPQSPAMARSPAGAVNVNQGAPGGLPQPGGAMPQLAPLGGDGGAPQVNGAAAPGILDPVALGKRIQWLSSFPAGLPLAAQLMPILDSINKQGTGIDQNGNMYRLGGANDADWQRAEATAGGGAKYKILESLASQAGRAVKIEPGDSVATGFQNMPPGVASAFQRVLGGATVPAPVGGPLSSSPGGNLPPLPAFDANRPPPGQIQPGTGPGKNAVGFPVQPGNENGRMQNPLTLQGATMQKTVLPEQFKVAADHYQAAQGMMGQLDMIDHNLEVLNDANWSSTGAGANAKMGALKAINGVVTTFGGEPVFDPNKIGTWESFNKESTRMGFELAKTLGSREAMQIVQQAVASVPNSENTYLGGKLVSSSLRQAATRQSDYYEFLNQFAMSHGGNTMGADVAFNKSHPVGGYVKTAIANAQQGKQTVGPAESAAAPAAAAPVTKMIGGKPYTWTPN